MGSDVSPSCSHLCFLLVSSKLLNFKKMNKLLYLQTENEERSEADREILRPSKPPVRPSWGVLRALSSQHSALLVRELTNTVVTLLLDLLLQLLLELSFL